VLFTYLCPSPSSGTINIGDRQRGRIKADSVIDCKPTKGSIIAAIKKLYSMEFQEKLKNVKNPYGEGGASGKIKKILKEVDLTDILKKRFYDINFSDRITG